jgi:hypothetical protein
LKKGLGGVENTASPTCSSQDTSFFGVTGDSNFGVAHMLEPPHQSLSILEGKDILLHRRRCDSCYKKP